MGRIKKNWLLINWTPFLVEIIEHYHLWWDKELCFKQHAWKRDYWNDLILKTEHPLNKKRNERRNERTNEQWVSVATIMKLWTGYNQLLDASYRIVCTQTTLTKRSNVRSTWSVIYGSFLLLKLVHRLKSHSLLITIVYSLPF